MKILCLVVVLSSASAFAQIGYAQAIIGVERASAELQMLAIEAKQDKQLDIRATAIRQKAGELTDEFVKTSLSLKAERERLMADQKGNAPALKRLDEAEKRLENARTRLKFLMRSMADNAAAAAALKSGFLERTATEVADASKGVGAALAANDAALATADVGEVELRELKVTQGKVRLFVVNGDTETELVGDTKKVRVTSLPVVIRADIMDDNRTRLAQQEKNNSLPQGTTFVDAESKCKEGHAYAYENASVGKTTWTTKNTFTWVAKGESQALLKGFAQRSSDPCSENDRVELHPKDGATQRLMLGLTGKAVWHRSSRNKAGLREENVEPQGGTIAADLVISTWPK